MTWTDDTEMPFGPYRGYRLREIPSKYWRVLQSSPRAIPLEYQEVLREYLVGLKFLIEADLVRLDSRDL